MNNVTQVTRRRALRPFTTEDPYRLELFNDCSQLSRNAWEAAGGLDAHIKQILIVPPSRSQQLQQQILAYLLYVVGVPWDEVQPLWVRAADGHKVCDVWDFGWGQVKIRRGRGQTNLATLKATGGGKVD